MSKVLWLSMWRIDFDFDVVDLDHIWLAISLGQLHSMPELQQVHFQTCEVMAKAAEGFGSTASRTEFVFTSPLAVHAEKNLSHWHPRSASFKVWLSPSSVVSSFCKGSNKKWKHSEVYLAICWLAWPLSSSSWLTPESTSSCNSSCSCSSFSNFAKTLSGSSVFCLLFGVAWLLGRFFAFGFVLASAARFSAARPYLDSRIIRD